MDAKDYLINSVLIESRRYMVPLYQRQFQWREQRLRPFWTDVVAKADERMEERRHYPHYMGALILAPGGDGYAIGVTPRMQVVDGQQRLTTFQILLAAISETARERGWQSILNKARNYLFNEAKAADTDPDVKFKLAPTPADRALYYDIVRLPRKDLRKRYSGHFFQNGNLRRGGAPAALNAYEFFMIAVHLYLMHGVADKEELAGQQEEPSAPEIQAQRLEALLEGLLNSMKLVVIGLDEDDDAQVIFETLNSQGEPLQAMDLVRNNIFHRAEAQGESSEQLYYDLWESFDDAWWRDPAPRARPRLPRIDHFLAHVLTAETGQGVSMRELYAEYRGFTRPKGKPRFERVEDELQLLTGYAPAYEVLEGRIAGDPVIARLGRRLAAWEMSSAYPVAMLAAEPDVDSSERARIATLLYAYIVRRGVCGLSTKSVNVAFQRLAGALKSKGATAHSFLEVLAGQKRDAIRFPDDDEFVAALRSRPLYQTLGPGRLQDVLWELELASRTSMTEKLPRPDELSIEHVLPRSWGVGWPFADGLTSRHDAPDDRSQERNVRLNTIGNLTLVTGPLNSSLGNADFTSKKGKLEEHSLLALNKAILARNAWAEDEIIGRSAALAEWAVKIWPRT
jgi:hypothetical protein